MHTTLLTVRAIAPARLAQMRQAGHDDQGNPLVPIPATGEGEPLRCCLRVAGPGETIALISYAPFMRVSVWREVGPVYIHAEPCAGYTETGGLPADLAVGPRVLRAYRPDGSMNYARNTVVTERVELAPIVARLLAEPEVEIVHVRTLAPQCYLYEVTHG